MLIDKETLDYLAGRKFSNGWLFSIPPQSRLVERNQRLVEIAQDKSVLHLGCADHRELIEQKIRSGQYLHKLLQNVAGNLIGVDINENSVQAMQSLGFREVYLPEQAPRIHYDVLILADVIEHIPNVELFLKSIQEYDFDKIVVTTPNAYRQLNRLQYKGELINTDHRYWFSPFTLAKVMINANYNIDAIEFNDTPSRFNLYRNFMLTRYPLLQNGILMIAQKNTD